MHEHLQQQKGLYVGNLVSTLVVSQGRTADGFYGKDSCPNTGQL